MKTLILLIIVALTGCASITFDPETGKVEYSRIGDQHIQGFELNKTKDGIKIKMQGQQSNADALTEAIRVIGVLSGK